MNAPLVIIGLLLCAGCATKPGGVNILCVDITVQIGGSQARPVVVTENKLGENATQHHTLPIDHKVDAATDLKLTPSG